MKAEREQALNALRGSPLAQLRLIAHDEKQNASARVAALRALIDLGDTGPLDGSAEYIAKTVADLDEETLDRLLPELYGDKYAQATAQAFAVAQNAAVWQMIERQAARLAKYADAAVIKAGTQAAEAFANQGKSGAALASRMRGAVRRAAKAAGVAPAEQPAPEVVKAPDQPHEGPQAARGQRRREKALERAWANLGNCVDHKPRQVPFRQPIADIRRQQKRLLAITTDEVLRHAAIV